VFPKVFLGGLPSNVTESELEKFFTKYGPVVEAVIMYDQDQRKARGTFIHVTY
jgi:RNA-binding protein Musashi